MAFLYLRSHWADWERLGHTFYALHRRRAWAMVESLDSLPVEASVSHHAAGPDDFLARLIEAVQLVAAPYEQQTQALPAEVHIPDEVALNFDDRWVLVGQIHDAGLLNDDQVQALASIDAWFVEMTNAADKQQLWTLPAMRADPRWEHSRTLARQALVQLGVAQSPPELRGVVYVTERGVWPAR